MIFGLELSPVDLLLLLFGGCGIYETLVRVSSLLLLCREIDWEQNNKADKMEIQKREEIRPRLEPSIIEKGRTHLPDLLALIIFPWQFKKQLSQSRNISITRKLVEDGLFFPVEYWPSYATFYVLSLLGLRPLGVENRQIGFFEKRLTRK